MPDDGRDADDEDGGDDARDARATGGRSRYDAREGGDARGVPREDGGGRGGGAGVEEEDRVADEEANDKTVEEEPEPAEEEPEPEPAEEEVKPTKRGGRSASTRGARGGKTSGIPRAPLRDKNAQAETA